MSQRLGGIAGDIGVPPGVNPGAALVRFVIQVQTEIAAQAGRAFLWLVVAFAAGITAFFAWSFDPPAGTGLGIAALGVAGLALRRRALAGIALAVIMFGLGHGAAELRTWVVRAPLLDREVGPFQLRGRVVEADKRPEGNHVVLADVILPGVAAAGTPAAIRITLPASHGLPRVGSRMGVRAMVGPVGRPVAPDTFQFQRFLYFQGVGASGFAVGRWYQVASGDPTPWTARAHAWTESLRRKIGDRIAALVPGEDGTVAAALINGEQSAIPQPLQEAYRVSGIAHILSVSGVHLSLLAAIIFFVVRRGFALTPAIALRIDTKKAAAWTALAATGFYLVISGMSVPAIRSFLMVGIVLAAILVDRQAVSLRNVGWAALLLMALYPDAIFGASFQMSFLAVLALVAVYEQSWSKTNLRRIDGSLDIPRAIAFYVFGLVVADFVAGGATAIFAAYHFNRLPTYSVITNLVAAPLTSFWIMPAAVIALLLMPFGLDAWAVRVMGEGVALLDSLARRVADWPGAQVHIPPMSASAMVCAAAGLVFLCLWRGRLRWLGLAPVAMALIQPFLTPPPDLLVDDTGRVVAVSDADGHLAIRPSRAGRFVREVWRERYGLSDHPWPRALHGALTIGSDALDLECDAGGCLFTRNGKRVLIATTPEKIAGLCGQSDAIVTALEIDCAQGLVVDASVLRQAGAHALWLNPDGLMVHTVLQSDGMRVWSRAHGAAEGDHGQ
ncbi:MAG: ComEC family competence protein [Rhodospirillaceae bacterium]|nr:ComEC family competence protein [Rhodospirillaceae bacterium]